MVDDPLYTNKVDCGHKQQIKKKPERYYKERVTMVNIDSRHRDTSLYEYQNHYKISLPRTFSNIKSIQFKSSEFVNTQNTIRALPTSKANNKIHWYVKDGLPQAIYIVSGTGVYPHLSPAFDVCA